MPITTAFGRTLSDSPNAEAALLSLFRPFAADDFSPACVVVEPDEIPWPADDLLVHHDHMTVVLERHHGSPVGVEVLHEHFDGDLYTRMIRLTPTGGDKVVEWGLVRLNFALMPDAVRDEILRKQSPLGAVLIKHDLHRRVKPRWFLRFPPGGPVLRTFGDTETSTPAFGRIGTIYCNDEPAIELLEIVVNVDAGATTWHVAT